MANKETFKRGQLEWALWKYFTFLGDQTPKVPKVFLTRIKRLLDLDRQPKTAGKSKVRHARYAFIDKSPGKPGTDVSYTTLNAITLALALDLLDFGFKQFEIVSLLRHIRGELEEQYNQIMENPPVLRKRILAGPEIDRPTFSEKDKQYVDNRIFAVINKVEFTEVFPVYESKVKNKQPIFFQPVFCCGINDLHKEIHQMNYQKYMYRKAMVMEIAHTVVLITDFLKKAPEIKRGRK